MELNNLRRAYVVLLASNDWPRTTLEGQSLLCEMRDEIVRRSFTTDTQVIQEIHEEIAVKLRHFPEEGKFIWQNLTWIDKEKL